MRLDAYGPEEEDSISVNELVLGFVQAGGGTTSIETGGFIDTLINDINTKRPTHVILTTIADARVTVNALWPSGLSAEGIVDFGTQMKVSLLMGLNSTGNFGITVRVEAFT